LIELNKIYNEDCLKTMKRFEIGKDGFEGFDLIIADPPYFNIRGDFDYQWKEVNEYINWCNQWINECKRILKNNASMYIYTTDLSQPQSIKLLNLLNDDKDLDIVNTIIWYYGNAPTMRTKHYLYRYDTLIFVIKGKKEEKKYTFNLEGKDVRMPHATKDKRNSPLGKLPVNVWYDIPAIKGNYKERTVHPTQKPIKICNRIINVSSNEGDLVYIPFAGSGSEIVSCINNQRNYIASEINAEYINKTIIPRIHNIK